MTEVNCAMLGGHQGQLIEEAPDGRKRYIPVSEPLGLYGRGAGAQRVYRMEDGSIYAEFKEEFGKTPVLYSNEEEAARAFISLRNEQGKVDGLRAATANAAENKFPLVEKLFSYDQMGRELYIDHIAHGEIFSNIKDPETFITGRARLKFMELLPVRSWLKVTGENGRNLVRLFERKTDIQERLIAGNVAAIERILAPLTKEEIETGMSRMANLGQEARPEVRLAHQQLNALVDQFYSDAQALGIEVAPRIENYFPRVHNMRRFTDEAYLNQIKSSLKEAGKSDEEIAGILSHSALGKTKGEALQNIMNAHREAGNPITEAEATSIFERFIQQNIHFISGHLERERISSIPGIEDARIAYTVAIHKNAHRLAEAQTFGASYEKAYALMDGIKSEVNGVGGERAFSQARKAFDLEVGRIQERLPPWAESLTDWQSAKLSLSFLANLTQTPINLPVRVGFESSIKALGEFVRDPRTAAAHAKEVAGWTYGMLDRINQQGISALIPAEEANSAFGRFAQTTGDVIKKTSLGLFNLIEAANRSIATLAGEHYFDKQVAALARDATDTQALSRLRELGFTNREAINHIIEFSKTPTEGLLPDFRTLAGKRISDETQFKSNVLSRPLFFSGPTGQMVYQFKQFSVNQTEFMVNNLFAYKRGDVERSLRTLGLIFTAFPAIAGAAAEARSFFIGDNPTTKSMDKFFEDPTAGSAVMAGVAAIMTTGTLGIVADISGTALLGNSFALGSFFVAPSFSTAANAVSAGSSVIKGIFTQDLHDFETAARVGARELGGLGGAAAKVVLGEPEHGKSASGLPTLKGLPRLKER